MVVVLPLNHLNVHGDESVFAVMVTVRVAEHAQAVATLARPGIEACLDAVFSSFLSREVLQ